MRAFSQYRASLDTAEYNMRSCRQLMPICLNMLCKITVLFIERNKSWRISNLLFLAASHDFFKSKNFSRYSTLDGLRSGRGSVRHAGKRAETSIRVGRQGDGGYGP